MSKHPPNKVVELESQNDKVQPPEGVDFLDVNMDQLKEVEDIIGDLEGDEKKDRLWEIKATTDADSSWVAWKARYEKISQIYFGNIPQDLKKYYANLVDSEEEAALYTTNMSNKVRSHVRHISNMLLKERPMFEPDPTGMVGDVSGQAVEVAARYLEHVWDKGGLRQELPSVCRKGIRANRGILKTYWSYDKGDIRFKALEPTNIKWEIGKNPEDSFFFVEERKEPFIRFMNSGVFSKAQLETIREHVPDLKKLNKQKNGNKTQEEAVEIPITEFYILKRDPEDEARFKWRLVTYLADKVEVRDMLIDYVDLPFSFFIPEREEGENENSHSMNDVANSSISMNALNFRVNKWVEALSKYAFTADERVEVEGQYTNNISVFSPGGNDSNSARATLEPVQMAPISQDIFFHLERLDRAADDNVGIHPNSLFGPNGTPPSNALVASTLLAGDLQNTNMIATEFERFLADIAYKALRLAYKHYKEAKIIKIEPTKGNSQNMQIMSKVDLDAKKVGEAEEQGISLLEEFPNIKVRIVPASAYTQVAKQQNLLALMSLPPELGLMQTIPKSEIINTFALGSSTLLMNQAARESLQAEMEAENPEIALANGENEVMAAGSQRAVQPGENHALHDQIHAVEEMFASEQMQRAQTEEEYGKWQRVVNNVRAHRQQHSQMSQQNAAQDAASTIESPPMIAGNLGGDQVGDMGDVVGNAVAAPTGSDGSQME